MTNELKYYMCYQPTSKKFKRLGCILILITHICADIFIIRLVIKLGYLILNRC